MWASAPQHVQRSLDGAAVVCVDRPERGRWCLILVKGPYRFFCCKMCEAENARLLHIDMSSNGRTTSRPVLCLVVASYGIHFEEGHEFDSSVALGGDPETEKKIRSGILTKPVK